MARLSLFGFSKERFFFLLFHLHLAFQKYKWKNSSCLIYIRAKVRSPEIKAAKPCAAHCDWFGPCCRQTEALSLCTASSAHLSWRSKPNYIGPVQSFFSSRICPSRIVLWWVHFTSALVWWSSARLEHGNGMLRELLHLFIHQFKPQREQAPPNNSSPEVTKERPNLRSGIILFSKESFPLHDTFPSFPLCCEDLWMGLAGNSRSSCRRGSRIFSSEGGRGSDFKLERHWL